MKKLVPCGIDCRSSKSLNLKRAIMPSIDTHRQVRQRWVNPKQAIDHVHRSGAFDQGEKDLGNLGFCLFLVNWK